MRSLSRLVFTTTVLISASRQAHADEPVRSVTIDDAVALALAHNPDSESADQDVDAAEGGVTQSRAFSNPSLFVGILGTTLSPLGAPIPNQFGITWTVPIGGKRGAGIAAARADLAGAEATRTTARRQLAFDVRTAFVAVLLDAAELDFAKQDQAGLKEAQDLDEVRYKDGKIAYGDVLKLRIQARGADDTVRQDELTLANDRAELQRLVGDGVLADDFEVSGTLAPPTVTETLTATELYQRALASRSDYRASQAGEDSATAALTASRRQPIPDLDVLLDYNRVPTTPARSTSRSASACRCSIATRARRGRRGRRGARRGSRPPASRRRSARTRPRR